MVEDVFFLIVGLAFLGSRGRTHLSFLLNEDRRRCRSCGTTDPKSINNGGPFVKKIPKKTTHTALDDDEARRYLANVAIFRISQNETFGWP